jgi:predicted RNase H-like nuclease
MTTIMMQFIGIDFGWMSGPSGLCCLSWENNQLNLIELTRLESRAKILEWLDRALSPSDAAMIAIDAPTIINNQTGMRLPDKLAHKHFGKYHAGCYPANLNRPFAQNTIKLGLNLQERGFNHAPIIERQKLGRYQIEVFPHPAMINLFKLDKILKYKKGKLADRALELNKLRQYIIEILPTLTPSLNIHSQSPQQTEKTPLCPLILCGSNLPELPTKGRELKALEDQLDSLICAYIGAHWWYWGLDKNLVLGDEKNGYIVIPQPLS